MLGSADALSLPAVVIVLCGEVKDKGKGKSKGKEMKVLGFLRAYPALAMTVACRRLRATFGRYAVVQRTYLRREDMRRNGATRVAAKKDPNWDLLLKKRRRLGIGIGHTGTSLPGLAILCLT